MESGFNIVLGTDSLASNHSLDIVDEMRTIQKHFPFVELEQMLGWVTANGAKALLLNHLGSFERGKKPGVALIDKVWDMKITSASSSRRLL